MTPVDGRPAWTGTRGPVSAWDTPSSVQRGCLPHTPALCRGVIHEGADTRRCGRAGRTGGKGVTHGKVDR